MDGRSWTWMGGCIVEKGDFNWKQGSKFPTMTEPYEGYHGLSFAESLSRSFYHESKSRGNERFGPSMSSMNAFISLTGIETLSLRMDKHISNTAIMVDYYLITKMLHG